MKNNTITGERLKECRIAAGYKKQEDVARILNVQRQIISYYETGERKPDIDNLVKLANLYNTSTDYLLGLSNTISANEDVQFICKFTGLSEDSVKTLMDINCETTEYKNRNLNNVFKNGVYMLDKEAYKLREAALFFINCILEDRASFNYMSINFHEYFKLMYDKNQDNCFILEGLTDEYQTEKINSVCTIPKSEMIDYKFYSFISRFSEIIKRRAKEASLYFEE